MNEPIKICHCKDFLYSTPIEKSTYYEALKDTHDNSTHICTLDFDYVEDVSWDIPLVVVPADGYCYRAVRKKETEE